MVLDTTDYYQKIQRCFSTEDLVLELNSFQASMPREEPMRLTSRACLSFQTFSIQIVGSDTGEPIEPYIASILEIFAHYSEIEDAYNAYCRLQNMKYALDDLAVNLMHAEKDGQVLVLAGSRVAVCPHGCAHRAFQLLNYLNINKLQHPRDFARTLHEWSLEGSGIVDLTEWSRHTSGVAQGLAAQYGPPGQAYWAVSLSEFSRLAESLHNIGLLAVPVGSIDLGDLHKNVPFCSEYGFTRGTPVDRYYLGQFVASIQQEVVGSTLEIGGRKENRERYGFANAKDYWIMDADERSGADILSDAHDPSAWPAESLDSVILFNVLEHCAQPWIVAANIKRWLRIGGKVFCAVPNAQRIHPAPKDFWRILPDAVESLFESYSIVKLGTYGNLLASIAALSGLAAEELTENQLSYRSPEYPVITWVVAQKT